LNNKKAPELCSMHCLYSLPTAVPWSSPSPPRPVLRLPRAGAQLGGSQLGAASAGFDVESDSFRLGWAARAASPYLNPHLSKSIQFFLLAENIIPWWFLLNTHRFTCVSLSSLRVKMRIIF